MLALLKFWKEGLIILLLGALTFSIGMNRNINFSLKITQNELTDVQSKLDDATAQLDIFKKAVEEQLKRQKEEQVNRAKIISTLTSQVNTLRNQTPPKECQAAIDWSIEHKSDLSWPK